MKRLAAAVACALLLHAGMFWIGSGWFMRHDPSAIHSPVCNCHTILPECANACGGHRQRDREAAEHFCAGQAKGAREAARKNRCCPVQYGPKNTAPP